MQPLLLQKKKILRTWRRAIYLFHRVRIGTKRAYKHFISFCTASFIAGKEKILSSWKTVVLKYHWVRFRAKLAYSNFVNLCRQKLAAIKHRIITSWHMAVQGFHRARLTIKLSYQNFANFCLAKLTTLKDRFIASWHRVVQTFHTVRMRTKLAYSNFANLCNQKLISLKEWFIATWHRVVQTFHTVRMRTKLAYSNFLNLCSQKLISLKEWFIASWHKTVRKSLRMGINTKRAYKHFVALCRGKVTALKERLTGSWHRTVRKSLRMRINTRRAYRHFASLCREKLTAIKQQVSAQWRRTVRACLKVFVTTTRSYRGFASLSHRTRAHSLERLSSLRQTVVNQYYKAFTAIEKRRQKSKPPIPPETIEQTVVTAIPRGQKRWFVPLKQIKVFFSQRKSKLAARAQPIGFSVYGSTQMIGLFLIGMSAFYALIVTFFSTKKGISISHVNMPAHNLEDGSLQAHLSTGSAVNPPMLAAISLSPESEQATDDATPSGYFFTGPDAANIHDEQPSGYSFWPKRITLRHVEGWGDGVSFGTDYSTLAMLFAPDYRVGRIMPMLDLRGHRFDNNTYAANVGIAGRYIPSPGSFCQILGLNLFYDWREGKLGNFQQIGVGLEVLGKRWDLRANGYAPISVKRRKTKCVFDHYEGGFFAVHRRCEFTSYGFNAEVGYYLVREKNYFIYAAGGPYYLVRRCHDRTRGGEFRIRPQYKDYLALDLSVSHDNVFGTVYQGQVILYLPLYQLSKRINKRPCGLSDQQIYQPIERFEVMPLGRRSCWHTNF